MDETASERDKDSAEISGLTPDMRVGAIGADRSPANIRNAPRTNVPRTDRSPLPLIASIAAALMGLSALGAALFVYADTRQEIMRLSTELAELRVSLDLYARGNAPATAGAPPDTDLSDISNRLSILEQNWRSGGASDPATPAPSTTTASAGGDDCLPVGMRLLVAAGDSYPVCGMEVTVDIAVVDNGYVGLADGTTIPSGGTMPLPGTACTIGVTSGGDEGLTGYGEIRVNC